MRIASEPQTDRSNVGVALLHDHGHEERFSPADIDDARQHLGVIEDELDTDGTRRQRAVSRHAEITAASPAPR